MGQGTKNVTQYVHSRNNWIPV